MTLATTPRPATPVLPDGRPLAPAEGPGPERARGHRHPFSFRLDHGLDDQRRRSAGELVALAVLLLTTAGAYLWDLTASGYASSFYAAAVQAGTKSWKAFFFGSLDASNFITVDKPPASLWVMELSGRLFGFSSLSMLVPEALMGVATVALVYGALRRWFGPRAGLVAGSVMATTPVAALMFRFNNPDALLVLLLTAGAYCLTRALERAGTRWLVALGVTIGFGFLAKMGEALLVVPAFGGAYLLAAPTSLWRRVLQLLGAGSATVVSAGWWVLTVALWPASSRPMIDGSPTNSIINLVLEYNGLGRLVGNGGGPGGGGGGANFSGATGAFRLFNSLMGGQASWLLPASMVILSGGLLLTLKAPRTNRTRAALVTWGGWLVVAGAVFSLSQGTIHTYYTVALAPPIAALIGIGAAKLWEHRPAAWARCAAGTLIAVTATWAVVLLDRSSAWGPWLRPVIVSTAALAVIGLVLASTGGYGQPWRRAGSAAALAAGAVACLAGPLAFTLQTIGAAHTGSLPSAGPSVSNTGTLSPQPGFGGGSGGGFGGGGGVGGGFGGGGGVRAVPARRAGLVAPAQGVRAQAPAALCHRPTRAAPGRGKDQERSPPATGCPGGPAGQVAPVPPPRWSRRSRWTQVITVGPPPRRVRRAPPLWSWQRAASRSWPSAGSTMRAAT
jgi:4-amino-4-deoxy-L-arabinose transferase-like glycosyltransferase